MFTFARTSCDITAPNGRKQYTLSWLRGPVRAPAPFFSHRCADEVGVEVSRTLWGRLRGAPPPRPRTCTPPSPEVPRRVWWHTVKRRQRTEDAESDFYEVEERIGFLAPQVWCDWMSLTVPNNIFSYIWIFFFYFNSNFLCCLLYSVTDSVKWDGIGRFQNHAANKAFTFSLIKMPVIFQSISTAAFCKKTNKQTIIYVLIQNTLLNTSVSGHPGSFSWHRRMKHYVVGGAHRDLISIFLYQWDRPSVGDII